MIDIKDITTLYEEPGYMDPKDFEELADQYGDSDASRWIIVEGTLLDAEMLFATGDIDMPTVVVRPVTENEWTSTYQARAWDKEETPDEVWTLLDFVSDNIASLSDGDEATLDEAWAMLDEIFEM